MKKALRLLNRRCKTMAWIIWLSIAVLLQFTAVGATVAAERPVVQEVVATQEGNGARIVIRADLPLVYRSYLMPELAKWVIDLPGAKTDYADDASRKMRTPPLERITVRQKEVNGDLFTRIGLDFKGEVAFSINADPLDMGRLVVLITPLKTLPQQRPADAAASAAPQSIPKPQKAATESAKPSNSSDPGKAAKTVINVRVATDSIRIETDGKVTLPTPLILTGPGRLVLDMAGVSSGLKSIPVPATNRFGIVRSRLGKSAGKLRIVFEVSGETFPKFQLQEILNGVEIIPTADIKRK